MAKKLFLVNMFRYNQTQSNLELRNSDIFIKISKSICNHFKMKRFFFVQSTFLIGVITIELKNKVAVNNHIVIHTYYRVILNNNIIEWQQPRHTGMLLSPLSYSMPLFNLGGQLRYQRRNICVWSTTDLTKAKFFNTNYGEFGTGKNSYRDWEVIKKLNAVYTASIPYYKREINAILTMLVTF